jgi:hypothetical protein
MIADLRFLSKEKADFVTSSGKPIVLQLRRTFYRPVFLFSSLHLLSTLYK